MNKKWIQVSYSSVSFSYMHKFLLGLFLQSLCFKPLSQLTSGIKVRFRCLNIGKQSKWCEYLSTCNSSFSRHQLWGLEYKDEDSFHFPRSVGICRERLFWRSYGSWHFKRCSKERCQGSLFYLQVIEDAIFPRISIAT